MSAEIATRSSGICDGLSGPAPTRGGPVSAAEERSKLARGDHRAQLDEAVATITGNRGNIR